MSSWLDQILVFAAIAGALAFLWLGAHRRRGNSASTTAAGAPPCAGGCCTPKLPPHLRR